jgi:hypothetical protein
MIWPFDRWTDDDDCNHEWEDYDDGGVPRTKGYDLAEQKISLTVTKKSGERCTKCGKQIVHDVQTEQWWIEADEVVVQD